MSFKKNKNFCILIGLLFTLCFFVSCGKKTTDAAKATAAVLGALGPSSSLSLQALNMIHSWKEEAKNRAFFEKLRIETELERSTTPPSVSCSTFTSYTDTSCTAGSMSASDANGATVSCAVTCLTGGTSVTKCSFDKDFSATCSGSTYTISGGSCTITMPPMTCSSSGTNITLSGAITVEFNTKVSGGDIGSTAVELVCNFGTTFSFTFDSANPTSTSSSSAIGDTFDCKIDGKTLDKTEFQEANKC
ncbi:hypothetical protein HZA26_00760 [Candidatus Nomurabacteria bacterium]|nr:hypothetical protein [Candidatus Nomurabacteria bacterium]